MERAPYPTSLVTPVAGPEPDYVALQVEASDINYKNASREEISVWLSRSDLDTVQRALETAWLLDPSQPSVDAARNLLRERMASLEAVIPSPKAGRSL